MCLCVCVCVCARVNPLPGVKGKGQGVNPHSETAGSPWVFFAFSSPPPPSRRRPRRRMRLLRPPSVWRVQAAGLAAVHSKARWHTGAISRGLFLSNDSATRLRGDPGAIDALGADILPTAGESSIEFAVMCETGSADVFVGVCEEGGLGRAWGVSALTSKAFSGQVLPRMAATRMPDNKELTKRMLKSERRWLREQRAAAGAEPPSGGKGTTVRDRQAQVLARQGYTPLGSEPGAGAEAEEGAEAEGSSPLAMHCMFTMEISAGQVHFWRDSVRMELESPLGLPSAVRPWARLEGAGDSVEILDVKLLDWGIFKPGPRRQPRRRRSAGDGRSEGL